uniref:DNA replication complex GINS protein PSF3 n=1 Tax=Caenorhabditis japonica TaxID=281687 RepID=A0A8R1I3R5_CAEJA
MLGVTKPSQNADGLCADTPLWLIESARSYTIHLPQSFSPNMQSILNADARNVNLSRLEQHYYSNGMQLCHLIKKENPDIAFNLSKCLLSTLTQRLGDIISNAAHAQNKSNKLDSLEMAVFQKGKKCKDDIDTWLRQDRKGGASKKRKRTS